ncbi:MAG: LemA family protein [Christensenellaceae bacterium]
MINQLLISTGGVVGIIVIVIVVVLLLAAIGAYNSLVRMRNTVEEAWATIDVHLKKRYDLIPNLVETVKGYTKHESETLTSVVAARSAAMSAKNPEDKIAAEQALSGSLKTFVSAVAEAYPQLQANANFLDLQNQLKLIESELASARKYYNGTVKEMNNKSQTFPSNIIASMMKIKKYPYFELDSEEERKNVRVQF